MKPQSLSARLREKQVLNSRYVDFVFELESPHRLEFEAGQHISIKVTPEGESRAYSIASSPAYDHQFEVLLDIAPNGKGVQFLQNLNPGDPIQAIGPNGRFTVQPDDQALAINFIATGSGVAPFKSMIQDLLYVKQETRPITLYWGLRHVEEMFWQDDLTEWEQNFKNFTFHPVISQAIPEWNLCRGRVTDCLSIHDLVVPAGFYLCGNRQMIKDMKQLLVGRGVDANHIYHESFF